MDGTAEQRHRVLFIATKPVVAAWDVRATTAATVMAVDVDGIVDPLEIVLRDPPHIIVMEEPATWTERGVMLVGRLHLDPALLNIELRVLSSDRTAELLERPSAATLLALTRTLRLASARRARPRRAVRFGRYTGP